MGLCRQFGINVTRFRREAGYSQEALSFAAKVARSYMSDIERGVRNPTLDVVERIAIALNVPPSRLLEGGDAAGDAHQA